LFVLHFKRALFKAKTAGYSPQRPDRSTGLGWGFLSSSCSPAKIEKKTKKLEKKPHTIHAAAGKNKKNSYRY